MCGSRQIRVGRVTVRGSAGRVLKNVRAEICMACGERYFDPVAADKVFSAPVSKHDG